MYLSKREIMELKVNQKESEEIV